jgi:AcrR family transcriptional regulator
VLSCQYVRATSGNRHRQRSDGARTRSEVLAQAAALASVDGLERLPIGNLAAASGLSKSGLYAPFGSKLELQEIFDAELVQPALAAPPGLPQLIAICDAFFDHLRRLVFPGGLLLRRRSSGGPPSSNTSWPVSAAASASRADPLIAAV